VVTELLLLSEFGPIVVVRQNVVQVRRVSHSRSDSFFIAQQDTDTRYWYSNSVSPSVCYVLVLYGNGL